MRHSAAGVTTVAFPHHLRVGGVDYALSYHFEPGSPRDGVTLSLPLAQLNQIPVLRMEWLVPGLMKEKLVQLIRTLPQKSAPSSCRCRNSSRTSYRPWWATRRR